MCSSGAYEQKAWTALRWTHNGLQPRSHRVRYRTRCTLLQKWLFVIPSLSIRSKRILVCPISPTLLDYHPFDLRPLLPFRGHMDRQGYFWQSTGKIARGAVRGPDVTAHAVSSIDRGHDFSAYRLSGNLCSLHISWPHRCLAGVLCLCIITLSTYFPYVGRQTIERSAQSGLMCRINH